MQRNPSPRRSQQKPTHDYSSPSPSPTLPHSSLTPPRPSHGRSPLANSSLSSPCHPQRRGPFENGKPRKTLGKHPYHNGRDLFVPAKRQRLTPSQQFSSSPSETTSAADFSNGDGTWSREQRSHSPPHHNGYGAAVSPGTPTRCAADSTVPVKLECHSPPPHAPIKQEYHVIDSYSPPPSPTAFLDCVTSSSSQSSPEPMHAITASLTLSLKKKSHTSSRYEPKRVRSASDNHETVRRKIKYEEVQRKRNGTTDSLVLKRRRNSSESERRNKIPSIDETKRSGMSTPNRAAERGSTRKGCDSTPEMSPQQRNKRSKLSSASATSNGGRKQLKLDVYFCNRDATPPLRKTTPTIKMEGLVKDMKPRLTHVDRDATPPLPHKAKTAPTKLDSIMTHSQARSTAAPPPSSPITSSPSPSPSPSPHTASPSSVARKPSSPLKQLSRSPPSRVHTPTPPLPATPISSPPLPAVSTVEGATATLHQQSPMSCLRIPAPAPSATATVSVRKQPTPAGPVSYLVPSWSDGEPEMAAEARDLPASEGCVIPGLCVSTQAGATSASTAAPAIVCSWNYVEVYMNGEDDAKFVDALDSIITRGHYIPDGYVHTTLKKILCISDCSLLLRLHSILDTDASIRCTTAINPRTLSELIEDCCRTLHSSTSSTHKSSAPYHPHSAHVVLLYLVSLLKEDVENHDRDTLSTALLERTLSLTVQWRRVAMIVDLILQLLLQPTRQFSLLLPELPPVLAALLCMCVATSRESDCEDGVTRLARELSSQLSQLPSAKLKTDLLLLFFPCHLLRERTISIHLQSEFHLPDSSPSLPSENVTLNLISTSHLQRLPYHHSGAPQDLLFFLSLLYSLLHSHCSRLLGLTRYTTTTASSSTTMLPSELAQALQPLSQRIRRLPQRLSEDDDLLCELTSHRCWLYLQLLESMFTYM